MVFRRWKGERFPERDNPRVKRVFMQVGGLLLLLVILETLYVMYVLWYV
ncbi:hypothetical protein KTK71_004514 [Salmonella enterica]|nr:hypothetical protein [Salmonella enterica]EHQ9355012.1 hypothetical protein [Salmonella enterica]EHR1671005.1 hypothetical protein [Salmonella enterica]EHR8097469.1 hypothetical protein [Salmonella enterica]EIE9498677.1 hypothetical protein [Salmonella enterica]